MMPLAGNSHPIVTPGSHVSRAPPQHALPAFLNLYSTYLTPSVNFVFLAFP